MNRAKVERHGREFESEQTQRNVHQADFGDGLVTVAPGIRLTIAQVESEGRSAVSVIAATAGFAVAIDLAPAEARHVAESLVSIASEIEASAARDAAAAIEKARRK